MASNELPFVSGYTINTTKNCKSIIAAKKTKGAACDLAAINGNAPAIRAFMIQCEEDPTLWPFDRTRDGKTSEI
jgi:hypothetical protein